MMMRACLFFLRHIATIDSSYTYRIVMNRYKSNAVNKTNLAPIGDHVLSSVTFTYIP